VGEVSSSSASSSLVYPERTSVMRRLFQFGLSSSSSSLVESLQEPASTQDVHCSRFATTDELPPFTRHARSLKHCTKFNKILVIALIGLPCSLPVVAFVRECGVHDARLCPHTRAAQILELPGAAPRWMSMGKCRAWPKTARLHIVVGGRRCELSSSSSVVRRASRSRRSERGTLNRHGS
jgi:hypothetical protein